MNKLFKILFVVNDARFLISHRLPILRASRSAGIDVHIACPASSDEAFLTEEGFVFHPVKIKRGGTNILQDVIIIWDLFWLYKRLRPNIVHFVTIKPVLYGGIAARIAGVPAVVYAISGLGYIFISKGLKSFLLRMIAKLCYRIALGHPNCRVIFQNPDDVRMLSSSVKIAQSKIVIIRGSGVDLNLYKLTSAPASVPLVLLASRMLKDKGVCEFVEAARLLKRRGLNARFVLVGDADSDNPASVSGTQLNEWKSEGVVEWWGRRNDMPDVIARAAIVCLPSYREGLPKVLIEAAACGRPIVTTDVPGCREIVKDGINGVLVPARDSNALANAIRGLVEDPELCNHMGRCGRKIAEAEFSMEKVVDDTLFVYNGLLLGAARRHNEME